MEQVNTFTQNMMAKFPSWMKMAKDPSSVGAQFLDTFGLEFQEFKKELDESVADFYINTAHADMVDILYRVPLSGPVVADSQAITDVVIEDKQGLPQMAFSSESLRHFYQRDAILPKFYVDRPGGYLYLRVEPTLYEKLENSFEAVIINGARHYEIELHHVWNAFDEFGLLLGLKRLHGEDNETFRKRILSVFQKPANSTKKGLEAGIARELGLIDGQVQVQRFDTDTVGTELVNPDGSPTEKLMRYAKQVNDTLKFSWDTLNFGEAYWFSIEQENLGIHYLPHIWDVDTGLFETEDFQSGIGSEDDLLVTGPKELDSAREFKAYVGLMGYYEEAQDLFPEILFQYKIYAKGKIMQKEYREERFFYTVQAGEVFEQEYRLQASQEFPYVMRTDFLDKDEFRFPETASDSESLKQIKRTYANALDKINLGKSNDILHEQTDPILRIGVQMATQEESETNRMKQLNLIWEDTGGEENSFSFQTEEDFLIDKKTAGGLPMTNVVYTDVSFDKDKGIGLGKGAFQKEIDTTVAWQQGEYETNTILVANGGISLNLDAMARITN